ncbi:hypothetical protein Pla108_34080 [Botrimarina colliarenosi]|uniref:DUF4142 domain-containing protein n=1 Tax=Botrimarina colliarenosi TaxID=2528001 RepID=A0A5C6A5P7_9BACT|nr:DUF4142 domain-containing protein [Botrimarina colliarenosi]TWT95264.1 hypothetical protein Pla108_34080 [Botrimarina colliarenosi]
MTMRTFTATALAVALTTGLGVATAQDVGKADVSPQEDMSFDTRVGNEPESFNEGQRGATRPANRAQYQPAGQQPAGQLGAQGERYEARRVVNAGATQQGVTIQEALVKKLTKANDAEIELAKMAQEKTDNDEVRKLTKTIIEDHKALNESLQQVSKQQGNDRNSPNSNSNDRGQTNQNANQANRPQLGQNQGRPMTANGQPSETIPQQFCDIGEKACDNALKMTKDMLKDYDGQDFNMAYLGQQCVAHTMMLAELKAIQSEGPQELKSVAEKAITKVEKHLKTVKQLAKDLEDDREGSKNS